MRRMWLLQLTLTVSLMAQERDPRLDDLSDLARKALAARRWDEAANALEQVVRLAPKVPEVYANLGLAYFFEGKPSEALAAFGQAQKLNSKLPGLNVMIALSQAELGRCNDALNVLTQEFDRPTDQDTGRLSGLHLIHCYGELKEPEKAVRVGESLRERFPSDPEVLYQLSRLHAELSSELMSTLLRTAPDSAWIHYANAQVQESLDRPDAAEQEYRNALKRNPRMVGAHYKLGRLILGKSRTPETMEKAKSEFEQELSVAPNNADAEYELGEIDREQARPERAVEHFERATRYHPDFAEAQIGLAKTLLTLGRAADALPHLQRAEHIDSENRISHYLLAETYRVLGDFQRADQEFAIYRKLGPSSSSAPSQSSTPDRN